jgi:hypothetical protein
LVSDECGVIAARIGVASRLASAFGFLYLEVSNETLIGWVALGLERRERSVELLANL